MALKAEEAFEKDKKEGLVSDEDVEGLNKEI